jgi:hypothetical protein
MILWYNVACHLPVVTPTVVSSRECTACPRENHEEAMNFG